MTTQRERRRGREESGRMFNCKRVNSPRLAPTSSSSTIMKLNLSILLLCTISLHLIALYAPRSVSASYYRNDHYDPEQQDGIPVFSARSVKKLDDEWTDGMQESIKPKVVQRRQADNDLDDGLEEEDEDEYKSGSSPHESIESPSYGESQRFARDGEEIEDFFDKHLGPPKDNDSADESAEQPTVVQQEVVPAVDPDDQYEAAASGPLASIFQTLLGHSHDQKQTKRPFLHISTSSSETTDSDQTTTAKEEPKHASAATKGLKASQSAQSFVESPPLALAISPMAAPSTISLQEPTGHHEHEASGGGLDAYGSSVDSPSSIGGMREIYIGRRPTVMSYLQQQKQQQLPQHKPLQHLSGYTTAGSANVWRGPNGQPVVYEQEQANDYSRNPVAASYVYQQQPSNAAQSTEPASSGGGDDDHTVTYNLSFGGQSPEADEPSPEQEPASDPASSGLVESAPEQQPRGYTPYNTRYTTSSSRALNNYYNNYYGQPPAGYMRAYAVHPQQQMIRQQHMMPMYQQAHYQQQQQYTSNAPTRYHRDPSESATHSAAMRAALVHRGVNYGQANYDGSMQR